MMRNNLFKLSLFFLVLCGTFKDVAPAVTRSNNSYDAYTSSTITTWQDFASATLDNLNNSWSLGSAFGGQNNDLFANDSYNTDGGWVDSFLTPFPQPNIGNSFNQLSDTVQYYIGSGNVIDGYWADATAYLPTPTGKNLVFKNALVAFLNRAYGFKVDENVPTSGDPLADLLSVISYASYVVYQQNSLVAFANPTRCQAVWMQPYVDAFIAVQSAALDVVVPEPQADYQNPFLNACRNTLMNDVTSVDLGTGNVTLQGGTVQVPPVGITLSPLSNLNSENAVNYYGNSQNTEYLTQFFPGSIAAGLATAFSTNCHLYSCLGDGSGTSNWQYASTWYFFSDAPTTFGAELDLFCAKSIALFAAYQNASSDVKTVMYPLMKNILLGLNQFVTDQTVNLFQHLDALFITASFTLNNYGPAKSDANTPVLSQKLVSFHNEAHSSVFSAQDFADDVARYEWVNSNQFEGYYTPQFGSAGYTPIPLMIQNVQAFQTVFNNFYSDETLFDYKNNIQGMISMLDSILQYPGFPKNVRELLLTGKLFYENVLLANAETMWSFMQTQSSAFNDLASSLSNVTDPLDGGVIAGALSQYKSFIQGYFNSFFVGVNNKLAEFETRLITLFESDPSLAFYIFQGSPYPLAYVIWQFVGYAAQLTGTESYYMDNGGLSYYSQGNFYDGQNSVYSQNSSGYVGNNTFYIGQNATYFGQNSVVNSFSPIMGTQGQLLGTNQLAAPINEVMPNWTSGYANPIDIAKAAKYARTAWFKDLVCLLDTPKSVANVSNNLNLFGKFIPGYGKCDCSSDQTFAQVFPNDCC